MALQISYTDPEDDSNTIIGYVVIDQMTVDKHGKVCSFILALYRNRAVRNRGNQPAVVFPVLISNSVTFDSVFPDWSGATITNIYSAAYTYTKTLTSNQGAGPLNWTTAIDAAGN